MNFNIYTVVDEDYIPGLIALVNSARFHGFKGKFIVGMTEKITNKPNIEGLEFVNINSNGYWAGNTKPYLILNNPSEKFIFIDSDIIINNEDFFTRLNQIVNYGLVLTIESLLPKNDYRRYLWNKKHSKYFSEYYYNSGFIAGIWERDKEFVEKWWSEIINNIDPPGRLYENSTYPMADQDALNAVLQDYKGNIVSLTSPDVWYAANSDKPFIHVGGFKTPAILHCTGKEKTWLLDKIPNRFPTIYDLSWYKFAVTENKNFKFKLNLSNYIKWWLEERKIIKYYIKLLKYLT